MFYVSYSEYIGNHSDGKSHYSDDVLGHAAIAAWYEDKTDLVHVISRGKRAPKKDSFTLKRWFAIPSKKRLLAWYLESTYIQEDVTYYKEIQVFQRDHGMRYWCATVHSTGCMPDDPDSNIYTKGLGLSGLYKAIEYLADGQDLSRRMIRELRRDGISWFNSHEHDLYLCEVDEISELDYLENSDQDD